MGEVFVWGGGGFLFRVVRRDDGVDGDGRMWGGGGVGVRIWEVVWRFFGAVGAWLLRL